MSSPRSDVATLPPLKIVRECLRRTTETIARELACPSGVTPAWTDLQWQLAKAVVVVHGVAPLLYRFPPWQNRAWMQFLEQQRMHVEARHLRIMDLLEQIDVLARAAGIAVVPLKGSVLHAPGLYRPGDRPMADIDLLVSERDAEATAALLQKLGYVESFAQWKHRVFKPAHGEPMAVLGEHRDNPVNIELHTRIQERLPVTAVDITARVTPRDPMPGLNPYPSDGALMSHLLLHTAGNLCNRTLRLLQLNDIALLALRMHADDWNALWDARTGEPPWWAWPSLQLLSRYYHHAIPPGVLARLKDCCPPVLRMASRRQTLTRVSCSELWLHAFPGLEWSRSMREAEQFLWQRVRPTQEAIKEREDMLRTQLWLQGQPWVRANHAKRMLTWLTRPVPRMDTLFVVRAALSQLPRAS